MSSSSLAKASFRLPWGREEVIVAVEAIVVDMWVVWDWVVLLRYDSDCLEVSK
jgi:lambda repressor-like predicted transcriptional regulator